MRSFTKEIGDKLGTELKELNINLTEAKDKSPYQLWIQDLDTLVKQL